MVPKAQKSLRLCPVMALNDENKDTSELIGTSHHGAALAALVQMSHAGIGSGPLCALHAIMILLREDENRRTFLKITLLEEERARQREEGSAKKQVRKLDKNGVPIKPHPSADGIGLLLFFCDMEAASWDRRTSEMHNFAALALRTLCEFHPAALHVAQRRNELEDWRRAEMAAYMARVERLRKLLAAGLKNHELHLLRLVFRPWLAHFRQRPRRSRRRR